MYIEDFLNTINNASLSKEELYQISKILSEASFRYKIREKLGINTEDLLLSIEGLHMNQIDCLENLGIIIDSKIIEFEDFYTNKTVSKPITKVLFPTKLFKKMPIHVRTKKLNY